MNPEFDGQVTEEQCLEPQGLASAEAASTPYTYSWTCSCGFFNPINVYICPQCGTLNDEARQAIIIRPLYTCGNVAPAEPEERKLEVQETTSQCLLCGGKLCIGRRRICEPCMSYTTVSTEIPARLVTVPENIKSWTCENCSTQNFGEYNCIRCSMIRKDKVSALMKPGFRK